MFFMVGSAEATSLVGSTFAASVDAGAELLDSLEPPQAWTSKEVTMRSRIERKRGIKGV